MGMTTGIWNRLEANRIETDYYIIKNVVLIKNLINKQKTLSLDKMSCD